jgi:hypothetical protein
MAWIIVILVSGALLFFMGNTVIRAVRKLREPNLTRLERRESIKEIWRVIGSLIFSFGSVAFLLCLVWYSRHSKEMLEHIVTSLGRRARAVASLTAAGLGLAAYLFKRADQYRYGIVEIVFGTIGGGLATAYIGVDNFYATVATFIGCIYVVARGCNNVMDGQEREEEKEKARAQRDLLDSFTRQHPFQ